MNLLKKIKNFCFNNPHFIFPSLLALFASFAYKTSQEKGSVVLHAPTATVAYINRSFDEIITHKVNRPMQTSLCKDDFIVIEKTKCVDKSCMNQFKQSITMDYQKKPLKINQVKHCVTLDQKRPLKINNKVSRTNNFKPQQQVKTKINFIYQGNELLSVINKINININKMSFFFNNKPVTMSAAFCDIRHFSEKQQCELHGFLDHPAFTLNDVLLVNLNSGSAFVYSNQELIDQLNCQLELNAFCLGADQNVLNYDHYLMAIRLESIASNNKSNYGLIKLEISPINAYLRAGVSNKLGNFSNQNNLKAEICNSTNFRIPILKNIGHQTCLLETRACTQIEQKAWNLAAEINHRYGQNLIVSSISSIQRSPIDYVTCNLHDLCGKVSITKKWLSWELSQALTMDFNLDAYIINKTTIFDETDLYLTSTIKHKNINKEVSNVMKIIIKPLKNVSKVNISIGFDTNAGFISF